MTDTARQTAWALVNEETGYVHWDGGVHPSKKYLERKWKHLLFEGKSWVLRQVAVIPEGYGLYEHSYVAELEDTARL